MSYQLARFKNEELEEIRLFATNEERVAYADGFYDGSDGQEQAYLIPEDLESMPESERESYERSHIRHLQASLPLPREFD